MQHLEHFAQTHSFLQNGLQVNKPILVAFNVSGQGRERISKQFALLDRTCTTDSIKMGKKIIN